MSEKLPLWHGCVMGLGKTRKSTFAASMPKPLRVVMFDPPYGSTDPYEMYGDVEETQGTTGYRVLKIISRKTQRLLIQLDCFWDEDPENPHAFDDFFAVKREIVEEVYQGMWATVVLDTMSGLAFAALNKARFKDNPNTKEPRQWHAGATDHIEPFTMGTLPGLPCNVALLTHIDEEKDEENGRFVRNPKAPGRIRKDTPTKYTEFYRAYVDFDGNFMLQTRARDGYNCSTSSKVNAPDPCEVNFNAVWANWRAARVTKEEQSAGESETKHDGTA